MKGRGTYNLENVQIGRTFQASMDFCNGTYCLVKAYTGRMGWMAHRKWIEIKQQPGTGGPGNILGCCLVSFRFLCDIHTIHSVQSLQARLMLLKLGAEHTKHCVPFQVCRRVQNIRKVHLRHIKAKRWSKRSKIDLSPLFTSVQRFRGRPHRRILDDF